MLSSALVITIDCLQLIQLDVSKKKLYSAVTVPLPADTVKRGAVCNPEALKQACLDIFSKATQKIKKLILVIPEDAAISKTIGLPHMKKNEIDEAVRWEAEAFLPYPLNEAILDWQKVGANGKTHILFQSVKADLVNNYIQLIDSLGVEVSDVETPALSLVRLAETKPGTRLLIYGGNQEAVLTLACNQEVIATSVVPAKGKLEEAVKKTVLHMQAYYHDFPIEWIQIGGLGVTNNLIQELTTFNLPVGGFVVPEYIKADIGGTLLLAISAALKEFQLPTDEASINLIPNWYLESTTKIRQMRFWGRLLIVLIFFFLATTSTLLLTWNWLSQQQKQLSATSSHGGIAQQALLEAVSSTNQLSKTIQTLAADATFPLGTVALLESQQGKDIQLARLQLSLTDQSGQLTGVAANRQSLLTFKQALEKQPELTKIQMPVSSFNEDADIPFQFHFKLSGKKK